jgi:hypothetical protein
MCSGVCVFFLGAPTRVSLTLVPYDYFRLGTAPKKKLRGLRGIGKARKCSFHCGEVAAMTFCTGDGWWSVRILYLDGEGGNVYSVPDTVFLLTKLPESGEGGLVPLKRNDSLVVCK